MDSIYRQFMNQYVANMGDKGRKPVKVIFNREGFNKARAEDTSQKMLFYLGMPSTYQGLPFEVERSQVEEIKLVYEQARQPAVSVKVDLASPHDSLMELVGSKLSLPELCDIIMAWANAHPQETLALVLRDAVGLHGRFE